MVWVSPVLPCNNEQSWKIKELLLQWEGIPALHPELCCFPTWRSQQWQDPCKASREGGLAHTGTSQEAYSSHPSKAEIHPISSFHLKTDNCANKRQGAPFISPSITEVAITVLFKLPRACTERNPDTNSAVQRGKQVERERSAGHICLQMGAALVPVDCAKCDGCEHCAIFEWYLLLNVSICISVDSFGKFILVDTPVMCFKHISSSVNQRINISSPFKGTWPVPLYFFSWELLFPTHGGYFVVM